MQRFVNDPNNYVDEMLEGIYRAYPDQVRCLDGDLRCYLRVNPKPGKVGIITGGGSGHLPLFLGYVGKGMLDGCCIGDVFQSPSAEQIYCATKAVSQGAGVLYLFGNYSGDVINFDMARELAEMDDIPVLQFAAGDDIASASKDHPDNRRGVAGIVLLYKVAGAAADAMLPLQEVYRLTEKAAANTRSMGVALSACIIPQIGEPTFALEEGMMEVGMGIHGETGIRKGEIRPADDIVQEIMDLILQDIPLAQGDRVAVLVNGLGATPHEELFIAYRRASMILEGLGVTISHTYVGEFATSMEMAGLSISLMKLDDELNRYLAAPCATPFFQQCADYKE